MKFNLEMLTKINTLDDVVKELVEKAKQNDIESQYFLGMIFQYEKYKKYSMDLAIKYFELAASQKKIEAMYELAEIYDSKMYKNLPKEREILEYLYDFNYLDSRFRLAKFYLRKGKKEQAYELFEKCANENNVSSIRFLGEYYFEQKDYQKALQYFEKGATFNDEVCIEYAFHMYKYAIGIEENNAKEVFYMNKLNPNITDLNSEVYELNTLIRIKQYDKALELLEDFEYTGKKIIAYYYKGVIYRHLGEKELAKTNYIGYIDICKAIIAKGDKLSVSKEKMLKASIKAVGDNKIYTSLGTKFTKAADSNIEKAKEMFDDNKFNETIKFIETEEKKKIGNFEFNTLIQLKARCYLELGLIDKAISTFKNKTDLYTKVNFGYLNILLANNFVSDALVYVNKVSSVDYSTTLRVCLALNKFNFISESKKLYSSDSTSAKKTKEKDSDNKMITTLLNTYMTF